jgi:uncharacterized membrane protein YbhN (UPF0104 family)
MTYRRLKPFLAVLILVMTTGVFIWYFVTHPTVKTQLSNTSFGVIITILGLYLLGIGALALVTLATLRLCKTKLALSESLLLTAYSSIVNFFGPLQSGPAFRAVYLKKVHNVSLKNYGVASIVYYFFYGAISGLLLISGLLGWWILLLIVGAVAFAIMVQRVPKVKQRFSSLDLHGWYYLFFATLLQIVIVAVIYFVELHSVAPGTSISQAIIYTGAANLALFVSLTPGAIGFRESFLLFSQNLHHISDSTIVAANILDRAMYIIMLLILAVAIFATHAQRHLQTRASKD